MIGLFSNRKKILKYVLFFKLFINVSICLTSIYFNIELSDYYYDCLYKSINENKCLTIKFTQWILSRYNLKYECIEEKPYWLKKFNSFFEHCDIHDIEHSEYIYFNLCGRHLKEDYEIEEKCISSGSIGQVYKAKCKKTKEYHALKIKHPDLEEYIFLPKIFIVNTISLFTYITQYFMPLDIEMFFISLEKQLNFNLEVNNINTMRKNFENNPYIIIPEVIDNNNDIIIMKYEEGIYFEKIESLSNFKKSKIAILFLLFYHQCLFIDNFNHGDLHEGNWKIRPIPDTKDYALIIYDFGICYYFNECQHIQKFIKSWESYNIKDMTESIWEVILLSNDEKKLDPKFRPELNNLFKNSLFKPVNMNKTVSLMFNCTRKYKIIIDYNVLNILISLGLCEQLLNKYKLINNIVKCPEDLKKKTKEDSHKSQTLEYINFCRSKKAFPELIVYYENLLKEKNINLNVLFDNIEYKLNTRNNNKVFENLNQQLDI